MINNVVMQGNLGKDPELRYTNSGDAVTRISIAVKRNYSNSSGSYDSDWFNVVFWKKQAELIANHFVKGDEILVTGNLETRSYENNQGQKVFVTEIKGQSFSFTSGRKRDKQSNAANTKTNNDFVANINDDDLPF